MLISNDFLFWDSPIVRMIDTFFPQTIFSVLIILLGVYLIIGKKKEMEQENFEENAFFYEKDNSPAEEYPESLLMQSEKDIMNQENFKTAESASENGGKYGLGGEQLKQRRVGTLTLGSLLVLYGVLFLLHSFINDLSYYLIFQLWPIIFVALGIEILVSSIRWKEHEFKYDFAAITILCVLVIFAMGMAYLDWMYTHHFFNFTNW